MVMHQQLLIRCFEVLDLFSLSIFNDSLELLEFMNKRTLLQDSIRPVSELSLMLQYDFLTHMLLVIPPRL